MVNGTYFRHYQTLSHLRDSRFWKVIAIRSLVARATAERRGLSTRSSPTWQDEAALYIHWPYCKRRCTYCNFNKYIKNDVNEERMKSCLVTETETLLKMSDVKYITTIFFGGGTPSLAAPSTMASIINTVHRVTNMAPDAEVTLEANPTNLETQKLKDFKAAGINRLSLGIQSLNGEDLKILGRDHTVAESLRCLREARKIFPGKTSIDLIFGRPGQTVENWKKELEMAVSLCDDHISLYQLTLERGTLLFKMCSEGIMNLPSDDCLADMYEVAVEILDDAGLSRYEVSNFAREGAESIHNKNYWNGGQYIGVGPGAHGRFVRRGDGESQREARIQTLEPEIWMQEVEKYGHATRKSTPQTQIRILEELLMLGLRTKDGISDARWRQFSDGISLQSVLGHSEVLNGLMENQLLMQFSGKFLKATPRGLSLIDSIVPDLIIELQNYYECVKTGSQG
ncbi:radical S-adenosyl methionine domain-containing protein 1, mitochondrial-like isoform X1 [Ptychodera flava]|uniref:radical S-adenosyl methionine domain-containing protein 1, mitochondrial-like isoform X1 n=1 Tax=Ptychodera flava TaxID=63121 RepID=UPI00396A3C7B